MTSVPRELQRDPIVEAVFEIRFAAAAESASDLIPGMLFAYRQGHFKAPARLPFAQLPREIQDADPALRYHPRIALQADGYALMIGDRNLIVSCPRPYLGWSRLKPVVLDVFSALHDTQLVTTVERVSAKYVNLLAAPANTKEQFDLIKFTAQLGPLDLTRSTVTTVHTEVVQEAFVTIIEVKSSSTAQTSNEKLAGILLSVDTICNDVTDFWRAKEAIIDEVHNRGKRMFFDALTEQTLASLGPIWEEDFVA